MSSGDLPTRGASDGRRKLGRGLVVFGLVVVFVCVIVVLEAANGPGTGPKTFAERRTYDQVKRSVHATYPVAFLVALAGLSVSIAGARLARTGETPEV